MADRLERLTRCRARLAGPLMASFLVPVLVLVSSSVQALGVSTPHVMSMLNEPLRARVALLDTETLRADDIQATLAESEQWRDMGIDRSAATDTLNLSVGGTPGRLYLDIDGGNALDRAWLDVVVSLRWPDGEITPQLTLLPATQRTMMLSDNEALTDNKTLVEKTSASGNDVRSTSAYLAATHQNRAADRPDGGDIGPGPGRQDSSSAMRATPVARLSEVDRQRLDEMGARLMTLEARLQEQQNAQAALALADSTPVPPSQIDIDALSERLEVLANRLDAQNARITASASVEPSRDIIDTQPEKAPEQVTSSASPALPDESAFGWVYGGAALFLLLLTAGWRIAHSWQQRRYRLLAPEDMASPAGRGASENGQQIDSTSEHEDDFGKGLAAHASQGAWEAHRAQIDAICEEAAIFSQHGRHDHAATMLLEGLNTYPGDAALLSALHDLESPSHVGADMMTTAPQLSAGAPYPAPRPEPSVMQKRDTTFHVDSETSASFHLSTPEKNYPNNWQLEEVAFDAADADNGRPDADDALRFRPYGEQAS